MRCNTVREATGGTKFAAGVYTPSASGTDTITTGFAPTADWNGRNFGNAVPWMYLAFG